MPSTDGRDRAEKVHSKLEIARLKQHYVRIERRKDMEDINGYVLDVGAKWALIAILTEGREPNGYELVRLKHIKRVKHVKQRDVVERRILEARGHWPLATIDVNLDNTGEMLRQLTDIQPVLSFHTEEKWPDMMWVGKLCQRTSKRTWYHALNPQAEWLPELESFRNRRLTRVSIGTEYVAGLLLVATPHPPIPTDQES